MSRREIITITELEIVTTPDKRVMTDHGSLEVILWKGEPAVIVDGKHIIRRSVLVRELARENKQ